MSEWPIELEITKGQDVGSFVGGGKRAYIVVKKKGEFSTFGFLADGQKGYGDVEITAQSGGITVVKGFKVVAPAPRVHIVPPWWWYGQPIKLSFDNLPILEFGETHTPGPGQKFEPVITWEPDDTINTADYFNLVNELYVKVKAENAGGVARDSVKLVFQTECIKVNFEPEELSPGDTARVSFQRVKEDGTLEDLPSGSYTFSVMIVGGADSSRGLFVTRRRGARRRHDVVVCECAHFVYCSGEHTGYVDEGPGAGGSVGGDLGEEGRDKGPEESSSGDTKRCWSAKRGCERDETSGGRRASDTPKQGC
jgi:hypothetical protein